VNARAAEGERSDGPLRRDTQCPHPGDQWDPLWGSEKVLDVGDAGWGARSAGAGRKAGGAGGAKPQEAVPVLALRLSYPQRLRLNTVK
jgi:hypothetical protein